MEVGGEGDYIPLGQTGSRCSTPAAALCTGRATGRQPEHVQLLPGLPRRDVPAWGEGGALRSSGRERDLSALLLRQPLQRGGLQPCRRHPRTTSSSLVDRSCTACSSGPLLKLACVGKQ